MELRVWVDGTQLVVCGVKLTTTCHEIVFALANATQQTGRFTMIESWRNNERSLAPKEQPLVTLQRWGDRMNEVEFILRKTLSDPHPSTHSQANHLQAQAQHQSPNTTVATPALPSSLRTNNDIKSTPPQQITNTNQSMTNCHIAAASGQMINEQMAHDHMYHQRPYSLNSNRRPQTALGPLTSSNSTLSLAPNYIQNSNPNLNRLSGSFRPSLSTSTLPNPTNNPPPSSSSQQPIMRPRFTDDQIMSSNSSSMSNFQNGYSIQSENPYQQQQPTQKFSNQTIIEQDIRNHPFEDLYSTVNRRSQPPPIVPAKPRVMNSLAGITPTQNIYNAQMNYYHPNQSPASLCPPNMRPPHPPGYLDYMEAIANKNNMNRTIVPNTNQSPNVQSNIYPRVYDPQHVYNYRHNSLSPPNQTATSNKYCYQTNLVNNTQHLDGNPNQRNFSNPINSKLIDSGLVINRGSAVNIKLPSSLQSQVLHNRVGASDERLDNSVQSNASSVSQIGHDMLRVIEEQKKLLMNQKNELDKLDNDQEYWEARQNSEQTELIQKIEDEIRQLEQLWKDNQAQIKKLENQDFEELLENLKIEQNKMELEIKKQQDKLYQCESDITRCKNKIEQLEAELTTQGYKESPSNEKRMDEMNMKHAKDIKWNPARQTYDNLRESSQLFPNGSENKQNSSTGIESRNENDDESSGDCSDEVNSDSLNTRIRSAKDVAYVDKRGLISGIRSLKLEKARSSNRQPDASQIQEFNAPDENSFNSKVVTEPKDNGTNNNNVDVKSSETNGHHQENTANKYEFLMTL